MKNLSEASKLLLKLLTVSIHKDNSSNISSAELSLPVLLGVIELAKKHKVLSLILDVLLELDELPDDIESELIRTAESYIRSGHRLLSMTALINRKLEEAGIANVTLKGYAIGVYYPIPELRKSGDIDILITDSTRIPEASEVLGSIGFRRIQKSADPSNHHIELVNSEGIVCELHRTLIEYTDNERTDKKIESLVKSFSDYVHYDYKGYVINLPSSQYNGISLLVHMLSHYLKAGFGLKLLCDWVIYRERVCDETSDKELLLMAKELGIAGFLRMIDSVCMRFLRMSTKDRSSDVSEASYDADCEVVKLWEAAISSETVDGFMRDILDGGEFGRSSTDRMVVLGDRSVAGLMRELHHQTRINYPKASGYVILLPLLWGKSIIRFLVNNRKIRHTSLLSILRSAKKRGELTDDMRLFQETDSELMVIRPKGYSMYPVIVPDRDIVYIKSVSVAANVRSYDMGIRRGDVVLFRRPSENRLVLHRVYRVSSEGFYMLGDNQSVVEGPLGVDCLVGKMVSMQRNGRSISCDNIIYRMATGLWLVLRPVRGVIGRVVHLIKTRGE